VVTLIPVSRRTVGLDTVSYLPAGVVKPAAVSYRSLALSDLRDGMLGMDDAGMKTVEAEPCRLPLPLPLALPLLR
jgi:hypothetical protein